MTSLTLDLRWKRRGREVRLGVRVSLLEVLAALYALGWL
jgi:hypothetical protein